MFQLDESILELLNTLECPICLDTADQEPIYQCPEGHLLCEACNNHLEVSPYTFLPIHTGQLGNLKVPSLFPLYVLRPHFPAVRKSVTSSESDKYCFDQKL